MKLHYYPETDSLYIELRDGVVVGLDIDGASRKLDLGTLEAISLPIVSLKAA